MDGEEIIHKVDTLATFTPSTIIEGLEISEDYRCLLVIFQKSFLVETLNNIHFLERFRFLSKNGIQCKPLKEVEKDRLTSAIEIMLVKQKDKIHPFRRDIIRSLIIILLYEIENMIEADFKDQNLNNSFGKEKIFSNYQQLLKENYYKERKLDFYATKLNISKQALTNIVKNKTGRSAKKLIEEMILSHAKILLKTGKYNVSEVATLLHYNNLEEFSRFFKKNSETTPLKFSKE
ncbi:hypothetical protein BBI01_17775 [Chryseobacterium artocarpi]|uniref:HTH araC/xylS-type domain-containing protein n=1 Tax=Chryseobacterium artocarpi TaxID=1414727 RepID=A0A1B8ZBQ9_9FLAO|nr:hypothetical protein BBI01_17775 [Chryseobacterium artocarpi]